MAPFGETVLAWRLTRGLSQQRLAEIAGLSRPNLSAIERGEREVTLRTLRALALALEIRPGVLADGVMPGVDPRPLSRAALERVARAAHRSERLPDPRQDALARHLRDVTEAHRALASPGPRRRRARAAAQALLLLKGREGPETVATLLDRLKGETSRS